MSSSVLSTAGLLEELGAVLSALFGGARYGVKIRLPHSLVMTFLFRRDLGARDKLRTILRLVWEHTSHLAAFATIYKILLLKLKLLSRLLHQVPPDSRAPVWKAVGRWILDVIVDGPVALSARHHRAGPCDGDTRTLRAPPGHPEQVYHAFLAGAGGGYLVWGRDSAVNRQIVLYLAGRVAVGLWHRYMAGGPPTPQPPGSQQRDSNAATATGLQQRSSALWHREPYPFLAALIWGAVMALFEESPQVLQTSLRSSMNEIYRRDLFRNRTARAAGDPVTQLV